MTIFTPGDDSIELGDYSYHVDELTYDVNFNDSENSNSNGFSLTIEECHNYIDTNNGTNISYFADYKGGYVGIVCNETGEEVHSEIVK